MYAYDRTVINAGAEGQDPRRLIKLRVEARDKTRASGKVRRDAADEKSSPGLRCPSDIAGATVERGMDRANSGHSLARRAREC